MGDGTRDVSTMLEISNPTGAAVAFKVKTTAPKSYCVRPNSGKLAPGARAAVQVILQQPFPAPGTKSKDKFLVRGVARPAASASPCPHQPPPSFLSFGERCKPSC